MLKSRPVQALLAICALVVALSIFGLASAFLTHLVTNIDGLLLLMICLMMAGIFGLVLYILAKEAGLLPVRRRSAPAGKAPDDNAPIEKAPAEKAPPPAVPVAANPGPTQSESGKS